MNNDIEQQGNDFVVKDNPSYKSLLDENKRLRRALNMIKHIYSEHKECYAYIAANEVLENKR